MISFQSLKRELLRNPEVRKAYDDFAPELDVIKSKIEKTLGSGRVLSHGDDQCDK